MAKRNLLTSTLNLDLGTALIGMSAEISQSWSVKGTLTPAAQMRAQVCWMELVGVSMQRENLLSRYIALEFLLRILKITPCGNSS